MSNATSAAMPTSIPVPTPTCASACVTDQALRLTAAGAQPPVALVPIVHDALTISVTRRCPSPCAQCRIRHVDESRESLLTSALARVWAAQLARLRDHGLAGLTFAGGEPLLAIDAVAILSAAATQAGIAHEVVTCGVWASQPAVTARVLRRLPGVTHWHIDYDAFDAEPTPPQRLKPLIDALEANGSPYTVHVNLPVGSALGASLTGVFGALIGPGGRALTSVQAATRRHRFGNGLLVRADGSTGPCRSGRVDTPHTYQYGDASRPDGLLDAWRRWHDAALQHLRPPVAVRHEAVRSPAAR